MTKLEVTKKIWFILSQIIAVLFLIFISLGTVYDNIPKITNLYEILFPDKVEFAMNSEDNKFFMIKSTLNANYQISNNFIKINTKDLVIQYKRKLGKPYTEKIGFIRMGIAKYIQPPTKRWHAEIYSQEININKTVLYDGSIILEPNEFIIPRAKIKNLSNYWIVMQIGNLIDNNTSVSSVYAHSDKNIFEEIQ